MQILPSILELRMEPIAVMHAVHNVKKISFVVVCLPQNQKWGLKTYTLTFFTLLTPMS